MENVNYGIIGTGYFGSSLAKIVHDLEGGKVVAVYDPDHSTDIAKELNCDGDKSIAAHCQREDVDAIIIASPNAYHKEPTLYAAQYKKHVFCEEPIALSYDDCNEMIEVTQDHGLIFMAGHVMNFMDGVRKAEQFIQDGAIGDVLLCHAERNRWEGGPEQGSWKKKREIAGGYLEPQ